MLAGLLDAEALRSTDSDARAFRLPGSDARAAQLPGGDERAAQPPGSDARAAQLPDSDARAAAADSRDAGTGPPEALSDLFTSTGDHAALPTPGASDVPESLTTLLAHPADNQLPGDRRDRRTGA